MNIDLYTLELVNNVSTKHSECFNICKYLDSLNDCRSKYRIEIIPGNGIEILEYLDGTMLEDGELVLCKLDSLSKCIVDYCNEVLIGSPRFFTGLILSNTISYLYMKLTGKQIISANDLVLINNAVNRLYNTSYLTTHSVFKKERLNQQDFLDSTHTDLSVVLSYQSLSHNLSITSTFTYFIDNKTNDCIINTSKGFVVYIPSDKIKDVLLDKLIPENIRDYAFLCSLDIITKLNDFTSSYHLAKF